MREIIIATHNRGKIAEFKQLLSDLPITIYSLHDFPELDEVDETGTTFHENAQLKAETIANILGKPVMADDSGLVVPMLNGEPGVYSARYASNHATDEENIAKLLHKLIDVEKEDRTAYFVCVLAFAIPNESTVFHEGKCYGTIAKEPSGTAGFGYDPVFIPNGHDVTFGELDAAAKNKLSHRYHALLAMRQFLLEQNM